MFRTAELGQVIPKSEYNEREPILRQALLERQRAFATLPGLLADGRDMGTVVFPHAQLKIFLTASPEERAKRRYKQLKEKGMWIIGLDKKANQSVYAADLTGSIGLLIGGEQKGIRPLVKKQSDFFVSIPQRGPLDSLNASVAAAVIMYEALRQRIQN